MVLVKRRWWTNMWINDFRINIKVRLFFYWPISSSYSLKFIIECSFFLNTNHTFYDRYFSYNWSWFFDKGSGCRWSCCYYAGVCSKHILMILSHVLKWHSVIFMNHLFLFFSLFFSRSVFLVCGLFQICYRFMLFADRFGILQVLLKLFSLNFKTSTQFKVPCHLYLTVRYFFFFFGRSRTISVIRCCILSRCWLLCTCVWCNCTKYI